MKSIIFISNNNVFVKNGNLNCEIQRLKYLSKYYKVSYMSMVSSKKDVIFFLQKNNFTDVEIIDNYKIKFTRILYRLNYLFNVFFCNKLNLYSNHFFFKFNILRPYLVNFDNIFIFYIFPAIFLNLSSPIYNSQNIFIDTNDILVDRHSLISKKTWFSIYKKDQDIFNKRNIFFLTISDLDYNYYKKLYNNVFKLFYFDINKSNSKLKDNLKVGYIASNSQLNKDEFMMCWENKIFHKLKDKNIKIIIFGSINSFLVANSLVLDNMIFFNTDDINSFYSQIDVLFCPVGPSTGIKTKVIEALIKETKVVTTKFGFDKSLDIFKNKIRIINYPLSFEDSINAINYHRETTDNELFEEIVNKYSKIVEDQFYKLTTINCNEK